MKKIKGSLKILPPDKRDFNLGAIFGYPELPPEIDFTVSTPLKIKDQGGNDKCTAYASSSVSEDQEGIELNPDYTFTKTKQISGDIDGWGANLRDTFKSGVKFGFLKQSEFDEMIKEGDLRNYRNWHPYYDDAAKVHKKESFFWIKSRGYKDIFDAIRAYLWKFKDKNQSVLTGINWCDEWTRDDDGIIIENENEDYGHAFKIYGQQFFNGVPFLICQLSNGVDIGDRGIFYLSREAVKGVEKFGAGMFVDIPKEQAEFLTTYNFTIKLLWFAKIIIWLRNLFNKNARIRRITRTS